jgi:hypothetical protein
VKTQNKMMSRFEDVDGVMQYIFLKGKMALAISQCNLDMLEMMPHMPFGHGDRLRLT